VNLRSQATGGRLLLAIVASIGLLTSPACRDMTEPSSRTGTSDDPTPFPSLTLGKSIAGSSVFRGVKGRRIAEESEDPVALRRLSRGSWSAK